MNIEKLDFGNKSIGDSVDTFWLEGPLEISAMEQVKLLTKLAQNELPYPIEIQKAVSDITILEQTYNYTLHGKTGLADSKNMTTEPIGWFVGWLEENEEQADQYGENSRKFTENTKADQCTYKDTVKNEPDDHYGQHFKNLRSNE